MRWLGRILGIMRMAEYKNRIMKRSLGNVEAYGEEYWNGGTHSFVRGSSW
jgi:hypothetical protein